MRVSPLVGMAAALSAFLCSSEPLHAAPPGSVVAATTPPSTELIVHEVLPGESLSEVADRYAVSTTSIQRWNKLEGTSRLRDHSGEQLKVFTRLPARQRAKLHHVVRQGDTWSRIARRYSVDPSLLQNAWNRDTRTLQPGITVQVWVEPGTVPKEVIVEPTIDDLLVPVPKGGRSVGNPNYGRLMNGVLIPENPQLYTVRRSEHGYGSTHAIEVMQKGIAAFRLNTHYEGEILIWDMSQRRGGRFGPHRSHRSGRDVDIALPLKAGLPLDTPRTNEAIDWQATWQLVRAFINTGEVKYIFLGRARQSALHRVARANGATKEELERLLQFPRRTKHGVVRHSPGHTCHLHVRFGCGPDDRNCQE